MKRKLFLSLVAASFVNFGRGDEPTAADKSHYTLFSPTPSDSLRVWRTDHAGVTPYTLDAGHIEADVTAVSYAYVEREEFFFPIIFFKERTDVWTYGITTIKIGLLNRLDAEVTIVPYQTITLIFSPGDARRTRSGFGDVTSRLKLNIWGNDEGKTALSISGNVKYPTANHELGNGQFEGGPSIEFAAQLPDRFELRIDSAANVFEDNNDSRQASFENLLSLSHPIFGNLEGYCVFDTIVYTSGPDWVGQVKIGLNYRLAKNIELYTGSSFGVTESAFDYQPFFGVAARF
jgi:Putative MetA-pathway of phenol degradation